MVPAWIGGRRKQCLCTVYGRTGATIATQTDRRAFCTRSVPTAIDVRARAGRGTRNNNGGRFYLPRNRPIHAGTIQLEEQTCVGRSVSQNLQRPRQGGQPSPALLLYVAVGVQADGTTGIAGKNRPAIIQPAGQYTYVAVEPTDARALVCLLAPTGDAGWLWTEDNARAHANRDRDGQVSYTGGLEDMDNGGRGEIIVVALGGVEG